MVASGMVAAGYTLLSTVCAGRGRGGGGGGRPWPGGTIGFPPASRWVC
jgi:hypothetical protein